MVTNVAVTASGEMFISDGYGNARVHRFSPAGELLASWGEPGSGPGQFNLPHSIAVDRGGRVFVADRENSRIQIFSSDGELRTIWDWVNRPDDLFIDDQENLYIAELGWNVPPKEVPHFCWSKHAPVGHAPIARVTICDLDGNIQTQIGGYDPLAAGQLHRAARHLGGLARRLLRRRGGQGLGCCRPLRPAHLPRLPEVHPRRLTSAPSATASA